MNVVILGSTGGIGSAFVDYYKQNHNVYALSRKNIKVDAVQSIYCDLEDEASIASAFSEIPSVDVLVVATGLLHKEGLQPEKSLEQLNAEHLQAYFYINSIAPALVMKHVRAKLSGSAKLVFLSARVGSVSDNKLGGWYGYRASKAALNMFIKTASIELKRRSEAISIIGIHPGTVDSKLSEPFRQFISHDVFDAKQAVSYMVKVIDDLNPNQSGNCYAYDGSEIQP